MLLNYKDISIFVWQFFAIYVIFLAYTAPIKSMSYVNDNKCHLRKKIKLFSKEVVLFDDRYIYCDF